MLVMSAIHVIISSAGFLITLVSTAYLISFLSYVPSTITEDSALKQQVISGIVIKDVALLLLFPLQHSCMKHWLYRKAIQYLKLDILERSIYVIGTSLVLLVIMTSWERIPSVTLWHFNTNNFIVWLSFAILHGFMWLIIYGGTIVMDINELLGVKQVFYYLAGWDPPLMYKSRELRRFYSHMRHPSFTAFLFIFWGSPVLTLDRVLLAVIWSIYMAVAWNADASDYKYQCRQITQKARELRVYS